MRVLVDTSVWALALRKGGPSDHPAVGLLQALLHANEEVVLTGLLLQEILQAFRADATFRKVERRLRPFAALQLQRADFVEAARLHRRCAGQGIAASTADCQIAVAAIAHGCVLLTADEDFKRIAECCSLRLLR